MRPLIMTLLFSMSVFAGYTVNTHVIEIEDNGDERSLDVLVSYDGRIFKVDRDDQETIDALTMAKEVGFSVEMDVSENFISQKILNEVETIKTVRLLSQYTEETINVDSNQERLSPTHGYIPSDLGTYEKATAIFDTLNDAGSRQRKSQCFNRAYVWSKHMYKNYGVKSLKILIYYSRMYRKNISGSKWWFHIAPVVKAGGELYVMDREFRRKPETIKDWQNYFTFKIPNKAYDCRMITHYSEFQDNYESSVDWCFTQLTSMYYWEPRDIEKVEKEGVQMDRFSNDILKQAAEEAFRSSSRVYDRLKN